MSFSADGRWWWNGQSWVAAFSPDGRWRWTGSAWAPAGKGSPAWVRAIFSLGPIVAGLAAGLLFWLATNDAATSAARAAVTWGGLVVLRLVDPLAAPVWRVLGRVRGIVRGLVALALPLWFSISQLGPDAANQEVGRFQTSLYASALIAYVLLRPGRGGYGNKN